MVQGQLTVDLLQGADGLEPLHLRPVGTQLGNQRVQRQRRPAQRPVDPLDPLGDQLLGRLSPTFDDAELGGHIGMEFADPPPHLRGMGVVGADRPGVHGADGVHGLPPRGLGLDVDVGQQRHRRLHLLDLEHVVPASRTPPDDFGHAARTRLGEQNGDRQRRRHPVLQHPEEAELHRFVFVVDDDGGFVRPGVRDLDRPDLDGKIIAFGDLDGGPRRLRRDHLGGGVRSRHRGGAAVRGHGEGHRRSVPGLGLLLAVAQRLGRQLSAVEDLAFGDGIGHEIDEHGVGGAVVDVHGSQREFVDVPDESVAQVHVLGTAQGQRDVQPSQGGAITDGDHGHESDEAAQLLGGVSERAGHRHRGDVGVAAEICSELGKPRLPRYPAG